MEDAEKIAEDTAIQIECKIRPMNAAEQIEPLHKDRSYNDDERKLAKGIVEMKKTDPAKHNFDYPQETFKFKNV